MTTNPYAPPKAVLDDRTGSEAQMWREGHVLVVRKGGDFPDRCIKCNAPGVLPRRRVSLSWHAPGWYLLILLQLLIYLIAALIVRKTAKFDVALCERHQKRVLRARIVGWGGLAIEGALGAAAVATGNGNFGIAALALALPWLIAFIILNRLLSAKRIDGKYVRLNGCGPEFLRSLPDRTWN